MRSVTIELLRFGEKEGILQRGEKYLAISNDLPAREVSMPLKHVEFLDKLYALRYPEVRDAALEKAALKDLSEVVLEVLPLPEALDGPMQIDVVTSAAELWILPFESIVDNDGAPLFASPGNCLTITRRIRQDFADRAPVWPNRPRVLFAHASPSWVRAPEVPADEHLAALRDALKPWIEPLPLEDFDDVIPDEKHLLTVVGDASLQDIRDVLRQAVDEKRPYSHIHLLAHGIQIPDPARPHRAQFGIALESADSIATAPGKIAEVLDPEDGRPVCVTLAVCDGANQVNTILPGSVAQSIHNRGVPIVLASQLPLTFAGSVILTRELYRELLNGSDVRVALHKMRSALKENADTEHDWFGVVAYVQLPEGYKDHRDALMLQRQLTSLRSAQKWFDYIIRNGITKERILDHVETGILERIASLEVLLKEQDPGDRKKGVFEENAGLLGSAYKRLAEFRRYRAEVDAANREKWLNESMKALRQAKDQYKAGSDFNLSAHWNGVQYLCLEAVCEGAIDNPGYWHATKVAAESEIAKNDFWAFGTLLELFLLAPVAGVAVEREAADQFFDRIRDYPWKEKSRAQFLDSTSRQLRRYIEWWTKENGFFEEQQEDLSVEAQRLLKALRGALL